MFLNYVKQCIVVNEVFEQLSISNMSFYMYQLMSTRWERTASIMLDYRREYNKNEILIEIITLTINLKIS